MTKIKKTSYTPIPDILQAGKWIFNPSVCNLDRGRIRLGNKRFSEFKKAEIKDYDTIIFGSGVYMGKMNKIKKVLEWFKDKPIIIFACAGNNNVEKDIKVIKNNNFDEDQLAFHKFFYVPGGVDFSKVKGMMKMMLTIFIKIVERKKNKTKDEEAILENYYYPTNYVDKKHIQAIVSYAEKS